MIDYRRCTIIPSKTINHKTPILILTCLELQKAHNADKHYVLDSFDENNRDFLVKNFIDALWESN